MAPRSNSRYAHGDTRRSQVSLVLQSTTESTNMAALSVVQLAKSLHYDDEQCHDIELAVREVVANAVLHGNRRDPNKRVFLKAIGGPNGLVIGVRDEGQGFDPAAVPDPLQAEGLVQESGRGLLLINALMDDVDLRHLPDGGMEVTLTKYPARRPAAPRRNGGKSHRTSS